LLPCSCCDRGRDYPYYPDIDLAYHRSLCKNAAYGSIPCNGWVAGKSRDGSADKPCMEFPACKTVLACEPGSMKIPPYVPSTLAASWQPYNMKVPLCGRTALPGSWVPACDKMVCCKMIPCTD